jgi:hypothetical protein
MGFRYADKTVRRGKHLSKSWFGKREVTQVYLGPLTITKSQWPRYDLNARIPGHPIWREAGSVWTVRWNRWRS